MKSRRTLVLQLAAAALTLFVGARAPAVLRVTPGPVGADARGNVVASRSRAVAVASAGRVEPRSEEIRVGAEITAKVRSLLVEEGQAVDQSAALVVLENAEYRARVASAKAAVAEKQAALDRLLAGARDEERLEAAAAADEARTTFEIKRADWMRRRSLFDDHVIAREEYDRSEHEFRAAEARYRAAVQRQALVMNPARREDVARARAELEHALSAAAEAESAIAKTVVRSPIAGIVLRTHVRAGETVAPDPSQPLVTVANLSRLRVRAEVDEADIGRVHLGQRAWVTATAYGDRRFYGTVVRVAPILGRKKLVRDEPTERIDTKVLETLVELDPNQSLPIGLRVDTFFQDR